MKIAVLKQLELLSPYNKDQFAQFIKYLCEDIENNENLVETIIREVDLTVFEKISLSELLEAAILVCTQNIQNDIRFDKVATRILLTNIYSHALKNYSDATEMKSFYSNTFVNYISFGVEEKLLHPDMKAVYSESELKELASYLKPENDDIFEFVGLDTALKRYMKHDWNQKPLETPQFLWMRIAMWMAIKETNRIEWAKKFYDKLSEMRYIPGGSTNIGAGTTYPTLSNCYILDTEDDTNAIYDNVKNVALISKATGGIGISITKLRASGSPVKSNNTFSTGPIPFVNVMDAALKSMSRAGKKYGAMCVYMENWHYDFSDFVDLKQNNGDPYRRLRTADTAVYLSDEFMKRVEKDQMWYMFDPYEVSDLTELYGSEFSKKYAEYCKMADEGKINMFKKVRAREQMKDILTSLVATSHPWLTWKDTINLRALNNNTGTIHSSNLCTEICLPEDRENIAVCNLAYINVSRHVIVKDGKAEMDWQNLRDSVRIAIRHLDNLVDVNELSVPEAKKSDRENRAVGLGMAGIAEVFEKFGYAYDSEKAYDLIDEITEFISFHSIETSANIAQEKGSYMHFEGSMWSKGHVPYDTLEILNRDRKSDTAESKLENSVSNGIKALENKIDSKLNNVSDPDLKEIYSAVKELTSYLSTLAPFSSSERTNDLNVENQVDFTLKQNGNSKLDWSSLREKVKKGMRNATLMAIAPNASTGLVLGTSPGIDVRFSQIFSRATSRGKYLDINKNLVNDLQKLGLWDQLKDRIIENYGDVSNIDEIPEHLKEVYKTSFQVSPYGAIEVASRAQKWIDQAMSRNMYLETRNIDELMEIYAEAWRRGLKTTYYLHTKPRHTAEQSTIKVNKSKTLNKVGFANVVRSATVPQVSVNVTETVSFPLENSKPATSAEKMETETVKVAEKVEENSKPSTGAIGDGFIKACPIDPAERALCESCQ